MKKRILILVIFMLPFFSYAQVYCTWSGGGCADGLSNPTPYVVNIVQSICTTLGVPYIEAYSGRVGNACASNFQGRPIITYNSDFMNYLANQNLWAPISVLAHEVGHHVNNDITWYGALEHPWTRELRADYISGYVLFKLGASLYDAQSAFRIMFSWMGTESHPDTPKRMAALSQGYTRAANGF